MATVCSNMYYQKSWLLIILNSDRESELEVRFKTRNWTTRWLLIYFAFQIVRFCISQFVPFQWLEWLLILPLLILLLPPLYLIYPLHCIAPYTPNARNEATSFPTIENHQPSSLLFTDNLFTLGLHLLHLLLLPFSRQSSASASSGYPLPDNEATADYERFIFFFLFPCIPERYYHCQSVTLPPSHHTTQTAEWQVTVLVCATPFSNIISSITPPLLCSLAW